MLRPVSLHRASRHRSLHYAALLALACAGGKETTPEDHPFSDAQGRSCRATLEKTSQSSPSVRESVNCEGPAKECSPGSTPCFELSTERESRGLMNCPACCKGSAASFLSKECSAIVCESDADCIFGKALCREGTCACPDGSCE